MYLSSLAILIPLMISVGGSVPTGPKLTQSQYHGWRTWCLQNGIITLQVAPDLGGRVMQFSLGNHEYFWTNPNLAGQHPPKNGLGPNGAWLNWGGDKLWPAPQGWSGPDQWPGPPDGILDGSAYAATLLSDGAIRLTSQNDPHSGIQFSRTVRLVENAAVVRVSAKMTNIDTKSRRWGIWSVTQLSAGNEPEPAPNPLFRGYIPLSAESRFPRGYAVLFGDKNNPEFEVSQNSRVLTVQFKYQVGKVGADSRAGWLANVDGKSGYVFVQAFRYVPGATYPDGATIEYWTQGKGKIFAWGKETVMSSSVAENPFLVETELLGPLAQLAPKAVTTFDYEWRAANLGGNYPVTDCNAIGCASQPLSIDSGRLHGRFAVFYEGTAEIVQVGNQSAPILRVPVSPSHALILDEKAPANSTVLIKIYNKAGRFQGELARLQTHH